MKSKWLLLLILAAMATCTSEITMKACRDSCFPNRVRAVNAGCDSKCECETASAANDAKKGD